MTQPPPAKPAQVPLVDNPHAREIHADEVTGVFAPNNDVHLTFASYRMDHSQAPGTIARIVASRIVMPLQAASGLERMLSDLQRNLEVKTAVREDSLESGAARAPARSTEPAAEDDDTPRRTSGEPQKRAPRPARIPFIENHDVLEIFADEVSGVFAPKNNVHLTFSSYRVDHSQDPGPIVRVVTSRVVMPIDAAADLQRLLADLQKSLQAQASAFQMQGTHTLQ